MHVVTRSVPPLWFASCLGAKSCLQRFAATIAIRSTLRLPRAVQQLRSESKLDRRMSWELLGNTSNVAQGRELLRSTSSAELGGIDASMRVRSQSHNSSSALVLFPFFPRGGPAHGIRQRVEVRRVRGSVSIHGRGARVLQTQKLPESSEAL